MRGALQQGDKKEREQVGQSRGARGAASHGVLASLESWRTEERDEGSGPGWRAGPGSDPVRPGEPLSIFFLFLDFLFSFYSLLFLYF